jgi:hypothetical protein
MPRFHADVDIRTIDDYAVSVIKHLHPDGSQRPGGALVTESRTTAIVDAPSRRTGPGCLYEVTVELTDGTSHTVDGVLAHHLGGVGR